MQNPFSLFFVLSGFDEDVFVGPNGLNTKRIKELGFEEHSCGGFAWFRRPNEMGGFDYLPFVDRFYPGHSPDVDPTKDRWLQGYNKGMVLFVLGEAKNRQHVRHPVAA